jgi:superfamily II DNA or RNA helicase
MWSIINKSDYNKFLEQYPHLILFEEELRLYENSAVIFVPRYFHKSFKSNYISFNEDNNWKAQYFDWMTFNGELYLPQQKIVDPIINRIETDSKLGIVKARPGAGKTVMGIYIAVKSKRRTLIIIDNSNLLKQWTETILNFTNLKEENIGIIQGSTFNVTEKTPIVICMVQTLVSKIKKDIKPFYIKIRDAGFDLVLADECHKSTTGPKYATASLLLNTKNIIGLSATPFVQSLHKLMLENTIGETISEDKNYELIPKIYFVKYDSGLTKQYGKRISMSTDFIKQRAMFNKAITNSTEYLQVITSLTKTLISNNHKIIIIAFTREQVDTISNTLDVNGVPNRQFFSQKRKIDKENDKVVVATYSFASHGFDMKQLSGIIIATPLSGMKSLIQCTGRILRSDDTKNQQPVVYDLIDIGFNGIFVRDIPRKRAIFRKEFENCELIEMGM